MKGYKNKSRSAMYYPTTTTTTTTTLTAEGQNSGGRSFVNLTGDK